MRVNIDNSETTTDAVTLDNCDSEPIHIPGHIQPHGALFAFDQHGVLTHRSGNAPTLLGDLPKLGEKLEPRHFSSAKGFHALFGLISGELSEEIVPEAVRIDTPQGSFKLVIHRTHEHLICEFEQFLGGVDVPENFVAVSHRATERLKRQKTVDALLVVAVQAVRTLTGFDRVMAYRFRHDDSGEVVAESVEREMEPFLGQRYPAGDIPQQARRLYILNTLRLIADVKAIPVPVLGASPAVGALDMSYCVLRSVSPIHLEYLGNMGVAASMSVSIVIGGKLWGMLACHHRTPRRVAYRVRMVCDSLAQILSAHLQSALALEKSAQAEGYSEMRSRLVEAVKNDADIVVALKHEAASLTKAFAAHAVVMSHGNNVRVHGNLSQEMGETLIRWLSVEQQKVEPVQNLLALDTLAGTSREMQEHLAGWAGVLALPFGEPPCNWVVMLRKEQIETIRWGGKPEKVYKAGPSGPRLTPRGSFDLWQEIVRGKSVPWSESERDNAQKMLDDLMRADAIHAAKGDRARGELLSMLGNDLRSPLLTILSTAHELKTSGLDTDLGDRLKVTGVRIQRLVDQAIDISRMRPQAVLRLRKQEIDLVVTLKLLLAETQEMYPATSIQLLLPRSLMVNADSERIAHAIRHLLWNAAHCAAQETPILVQLVEVQGTAVLEITNESTPIPPDTVRSMFQPIRTDAMSPQPHGQRAGVGLSIAHQIVENHGGALSYTYAEPYVVFSLLLPAVRPATGAKQASVLKPV